MSPKLFCEGYVKTSSMKMYSAEYIEQASCPVILRDIKVGEKKANWINFHFYAVLLREEGKDEGGIVLTGIGIN